MPNFCELCGNEIPDTLNACPVCGLRIDFDENRPDIEAEPQGGSSPYDPFAGQQEAGDPYTDPFAGQQEAGDPYTDPFAGPESAPGSPLDNQYRYTMETLPPGTLPPPQPGAEGGYGYPPPQPGARSGYGYPPPQPGAWPPGQPGTPWGFQPPVPGRNVPGAWGTPSGTQKSADEIRSSNRSIILLVTVFIIGLLLLGGSAFAYFTFLKPSSADDAATAMINNYLNAVGSGDSQKVAALHVSGMQPSREVLREISALGGIVKLTYSNVKVEEVSSTPGEMEVKITEAKLSMDMGGQSDSITLDEMRKAFGDNLEPVTVRLKQQDGAWLVNQPEIIDPFCLQIDATTPAFPLSGS